MADPADFNELLRRMAGISTPQETPPAVETSPVTGSADAGIGAGPELEVIYGPEGDHQHATPLDHLIPGIERSPYDD